MDLDQAIEHVAAVRRGDAVPPGTTAAALAVVDAEIARHQDAVFAMCRRVVRPSERAQEVAQEAMLVAFRKLHTFRGDSAFRTWLLGIARLRALRAARDHKDHLTDDGIFEAGDPQRDVAATLRRHEREEVIRRASMKVLDSLEQEAVHLRYVEGLGQDEITHILGLTNASGARGLLVRCRRKLKAEVERQLRILGHGTSFIRSEGA